jgi:hypothetical protein
LTNILCQPAYSLVLGDRCGDLYNLSQKMTGRIRYISGLVFALSVALLGFAALSLLSYPSRVNLAAAQQFTAERLQELRTTIMKEIGTPTADEPSQCKLIAFGSKPCGGPASYLVYSTTRTNEARLKQLVGEFNQLAKKFNEERKLLSDCMFVTEPNVDFVNGVCRIKAN